jgi:hypothetical protein
MIYQGGSFMKRLCLFLALFCVFSGFSFADDEPYLTEFDIKSLMTALEKDVPEHTVDLYGTLIVSRHGRARGASVESISGTALVDIRHRSNGYQIILYRGEDKAVFKLPNGGRVIDHYTGGKADMYNYLNSARFKKHISMPNYVQEALEGLDGVISLVAGTWVWKGEGETETYTFTSQKTYEFEGLLSGGAHIYGSGFKGTFTISDDGITFNPTQYYSYPPDTKYKNLGSHEKAEGLKTLRYGVSGKTLTLGGKNFTRQ